MGDKRRGRGRPSYKPSDEHRRLIEGMAAVGITHEQIASVVQISADTLTKYYRVELEASAIKANAKMGQALYQNGMKGNVAAQIFWMKTRGRWRENSEQEEKVEPRPQQIILDIDEKPKR